jgi:hypothetical protein
MESDASLIESEILILWARSEMIGYAIGQVRSWCQVSGVRKKRILSPEH